jgi:hypothetical protein
VRRLTLNILESIVTAGYFERKKKRYVILSKILTDALTNEAFREARNIQHVIKIMTWSISDLAFIKYLCYKNREGG